MKKLIGVTLLEIMLVLAIATAISAIVIRQYQSARNDAEADRLLANVDAIFLAAANYYQANCRQQKDSSGNPVSGVTATLDPANTSETVYPVLNSSINLLLSENYFLGVNWPFALNYIVDSSGNNRGYIAQFNRLDIGNRTPTGYFNNWVSGTTVAPSYSGTPPIGNAYIWKIQVSIKLAANLVSNARTYRARLGADCISTLSGTYVNPCSGSTSGDYLVWERLPSFSSKNSISTWSPAMQRVKSFTNLYYTDDIYGATNPTWGGASNNYLCGG